MAVLVQTCLAWLVVVLFLNRVKHKNQTTTYTWTFIILWSMATTIQIDFIANAVNQWAGINRLSWLISYLVGLTALYYLYQGLYVTLNPSVRETNRWLYYGFVVTMLWLIVTFPSVARDEGEMASSLPIMLFRAGPFLYVAILGISIASLLYRYQRKQAQLYMRVRWLMLSAAAFLGSLHFGLRSPYIVLVYLFPHLADTAVATFFTGIVLYYLELTRIGWVFFFIPVSVYRELCRPFLFAHKYLTLKELERLQEELISLLSLTVRLPLNPTWQWRWQNLDFLQYQAVVVIMEGKRKIADLVAKDAIPETDKLRYLLLNDLLDPVQDDPDFDSLISMYKRAGRQYRQSLAAKGYSLLSKVWAEETLPGQAESAIALANNIVSELNLDFSQFSMKTLKTELEQITGRKIFLFTMPFPESFYGAWLSDAENPYEYIFCNELLSPLHQVHVRLHELGHFLCGHETARITSDDLAKVIGTESLSPFVAQSLTYKPYTAPEKKQCEAEAEAVAMVTQAHAIKTPVNLSTIPNKNEVERFLYEMGLN